MQPWDGWTRNSSALTAALTRRVLEEKASVMGWACTGIFFDRQTPESLAAGIAEMEHWLPYFNPSDAVSHAQNFAPEHFDEKIRQLTKQYS